MGNPIRYEGGGAFIFWYVTVYSALIILLWFDVESLQFAEG